GQWRDLSRDDCGRLDRGGCGVLFATGVGLKAEFGRGFGSPQERRRQTSAACSHDVGLPSSQWTRTDCERSKRYRRTPILPEIRRIPHSWHQGPGLKVVLTCLASYTDFASTAWRLIYRELTRRQYE